MIEIFTKRLLLIIITTTIATVLIIYFGVISFEKIDSYDDVSRDGTTLVSAEELLIAGIGETEFDPENFNMPEMVAGYEIAAVQTTATTDCLDDGVTHVILIRRPGFVELDNQVTPEIIAAFQAINPQTTWSFDFVDRDNLYRLLGDTELGERMRTVVCRVPMGGGPPDFNQATPVTPPRTDPLVTNP